MKNIKNSKFLQNIINPVVSLILTGISFSFIVHFEQFQSTTVYILGLSFITIGLLFFFLYASYYLWGQKNILFLLFSSIIFGSTGIPFFINQLNLLDFFFYIGIGIGLILLISGIQWKLFGLLIPGSIILGIMPGIYFAWEDSNATNALEQTGVMLVWFALGWGLITILSRALTKNFVWWPLIPGGILAVVGWGLFIAGNPESAISFIGNTGSIGLIIFGIYILLMRRSFHN